MMRQPPLTRFRLDGLTLVIDLDRRLKVLASAPFRGGLVRARYLLNHQVPANPIERAALRRDCRGCYPAGYLKQLAAEMGTKGDAVALMTAVPLKQCVALRAASEDLWVEAWITVGVTNAVRAGDPATAGRGAGAKPGTINIILVTNARLPVSAMVGAVQVITESKTAALLEARVPASSGSGATGTGTDAVVVACGAGRKGPQLRYSGTHTTLGELIGSLVAHGVREGLKRSKRRPLRRPA
jgi:adenosylcobinamide hydrolase